MNEKVHLKLVKIKGGISMWCKTTITFENGKKKQVCEWFKEKPDLSTS